MRVRPVGRQLGGALRLIRISAKSPETTGISAMKRLLAALLFIFGFLFSQQPSHAQVFIVASCGTVPTSQATLTAGNPGMLFIDNTGKLCTAASVTASVSGFSPGGTFATLTATGSSASVALPAGAVVAFQNTGTVTVSCTLGIGSATATTNEIQVPGSSTVFLTVGSNTFGACIDQTGSTSNLVVLLGGAGLGTGFGGGGGSGGGGAITAALNSYAAGALSAGAFATGAGVDGWDLTQGAKADALCTVPTSATACSVISLLKALTNVANNPISACAAAPCVTTVGNFGFDPSSGKGTPTEAFLALPATTTTQIIALNGSKVTYVTLAKVLAGGTVNVTFKYGTGSNCGTGTTTLEGPYPLTAQAGWVEGNGAGPVMIVPSGQALCITTDASVGGGAKLIFQQI